MTNFEKIKQMNIEQLAEFLYHIDSFSGYRHIGGDELLFDDEASIVKWLKSEAE